MEATLRTPLGLSSTSETKRWVLTGFAGSTVMAIVGARIGNLPNGGAGHWWYTLPLPSGGLWAVAIWATFYVAMVGVIYSWWRLGHMEDPSALTPGLVTAVAAFWALPLLIGPPLFSGDVYSYAAQGTLAQEGLNPYQMGPIALAPGPILGSVAQVWLYTPAPYGPLFIILAKIVVTIFGNSLIASVMALRFIDLAGVALVARFLPRLALRLGADPGRALWLAILSPVALYSFIASSHNDALMVGFLVAGVALAMEERPLAGVAMCAIGMAIKVPDAAGIAFITASWMFAQRGLAAKARVLAVSATTTGAILAALTIASGFGWGWLGPSTLATPTDITIASAPTAAIGMTIGNLLNWVGAPVPVGIVVALARGAGGVAAVAISAALILRSRKPLMPITLAISFMAVVLLGPILWPWYLTWGLVLLAATKAQRSPALWIGSIASMGMVLPEGSPTLIGASYLGIAALSIGLAAWSIRTGKWRSLAPGLVR